MDWRSEHSITFLVRWTQVIWEYYHIALKENNLPFNHAIPLLGIGPKEIITYITPESSLWLFVEGENYFNCYLKKKGKWLNSLHAQIHTPILGSVFILNNFIDFFQ